MQPSIALPRIVRFGPFELNVRTGELRKHGVKLKLQEQPLQVLSMLLERPGDVVTREELRDRIWSAQTFVDFDHGLNKAINKIRETLGDSAANSRYVETLARRGYRFLAPVDLTGTNRANGTAGKARLAVLPFQNVSSDLEQGYFSDGMTEEMISHLGRLNPQRLGVIGRTSAMQYKNSAKRIQQIGEELNVDYVVEGSVRRTQNRVRITAQLIHAKDETHLWAASYERELADIFAVQNEVSASIARALAIELLPEYRDTACRWKTIHPAAHEEYLRGRFFWSHRSEGALNSAIQCFEKALKEDPSYALAYSGLADCYAMLPWFGALPPASAAPKAKTAARRALEIDESLGEGHCSLALVYFWYEWDWESAEREFGRALECNSNYATAHHWYGAFLASQGRFEEAAAQQRAAQELDPLSLIIAKSAGDTSYFNRHYDDAIAQFGRVLTHEPAFSPAYFDLGRAYVLKGAYEGAVACLQKALELSGNREGMAVLAYAHARAGRADKAREMLAELQSPAARYTASPLIALIYLGLGDMEQTWEWLRRGIEERSCWLVNIRVDPMFDELRADARCGELLQLIRPCAHGDPSGPVSDEPRSDINPAPFPT